MNGKLNRKRMMNAGFGAAIQGRHQILPLYPDREL